MSTLTLAQARTLIDGALAAARQHGFKPMGVVVVDAAAQAIASAREDGASALRLDIAHGKAGAAIGMGANSRALATRAKDMPAFFGAIASNAQHPFIPQTGAVLITDGTTVIGAAGASGGTGDEDEQIVIAGILAAGLSNA